MKEQRSTIIAPFLEQFEQDWASRWIPSTAKKIVDGEVDEDLLQYRGLWALEEPKDKLIEGDTGLVLKTLAAHSAISVKFDKPIDPAGKPLVLQYEVKTQNGLECGGAYIKLLTYDPKFSPDVFGDKTPYTIMFGPDKCGLNNKVHFIFRHKNPVSGVIEEKHLTSPPQIVSDKKTNLYTLIVKPDQTFEILINNESSKSGSLLENFEPPVNPPKQIDDPEDKKPSDWVDEAKIKDPEASKPEDWDEDAPLEIVDPNAVQPEDWLVDEPDTIPDPDVSQPEDWDEEEDGEWTAPTVPNPRCAEVSGCGKWSAPIIRNPAYKGKWSAPMIDNPAYKGEWSPRKIDNPYYFEDKNPAAFTKIGGIGLELWSMQNDFLFDNIYLGHDVAEAKKLAAETWAIKSKIEKELDPPAPESVEPTLLEQASGVADLLKKYFDDIVQQAIEFYEMARQDPVEALKELPHIAVLLVVSVLLPILIISFACGGAEAKPVAKKTKTEKKEEKEEKKEVVEEKKGGKGFPKKSPKKTPKKDDE
ncbi:hypothetical protein HDV02_006390 [Globomyces sp. JEL0801]|nr:hypothetical protein HDV02_006390 [Globomyces sp. JEL0801]